MATNERTENEARRNLQTYLRQLAYFDESIPLVPIDGNRGSDTSDAIRAFQRKRGLPVTGIADQETWEAIYEEYLISLEEAAPPSRFSPFPEEPADYALREGDRGFPVSALQFMLEEISVFFPISAVRIDGIYGPETRDAVSELQARYLLPVTGETDKLTWNAVVRLYDSAQLYQ
ncbi:MAG: peptidoglycan-binding protein [Clostridia bacterium]|nr:peptidoglycan-binding protein [Clostridia bacterium]